MSDKFQWPNLKSVHKSYKSALEIEKAGKRMGINTCWSLTRSWEMTSFDIDSVFILQVEQGLPIRFDKHSIILY